MDDNFAHVILTVALAIIAAPAFAQQSPEAAKPAVAPSPAATPSPGVAPSPAAAADTAAQDAEVAAVIAAIAKAKAAAAKAPDDKSETGGDASMTRKAKEFGWHSEVKRGVTVYCREAPVIGSRFTQKKCATDSQLAAYLEQQEYERDQLSQRGCGGNCGGK
ncbi:MAG TPA: hypothetical protein VGD63_21680 [Steroidobacteraceae bacterium]